MKKSIRARGFAPVLSALSIVCVQAYAQAQPPISPDVVVTAERRPRTSDQTFQSVSVVTREQIESSGALSIMDLLNGLAGVNISRNGGLGKATSVFMRGTNTNQLLVLIDGVRVSAAGTGTFDWNAIVPEQIEKIEVVRGPLATLYGSDAIGGVIQIFTRQARPGVAISHTVGSFGTQQTEMSFGGGDAWRYGLRLGQMTTDGMQTLLNNSTKFGATQKHIDGNLFGQIDSNTNLHMGLSYMEGANKDESGPSSTHSYHSFARVDHVNSDVWSQVLQLNAAGVSLLVPQGYPPGKFNTERVGLSWQHLLKFGKSELNVGLETWSDHVVKMDYDNSANNLSNDLNSKAVFGQYAVNWLDFDWRLGLRQDRHNVYGNQSTHNIGLGKKINSKLQLLASYGTAFKAPAANDLYWPHSVEPSYDNNGPTSFAAGTCGPTVYNYGSPTPCFYDFNGNLNLKPEQSKTSEIGMRYVDGFSAHVNYFETNISNLITWNSSVSGTGANYGAYYMPENLQSVNIRGLETGLSQQVGAWFFAGQYTRLLATNADKQQQLDRRPKNSAALTASTKMGSHKISASTVIASERLDSGGTVVLPGYAVLNLSDLITLNQAWSVQLRMENVLNRDYRVATSFGTPYATPGRSGYVTLRYNMH
jgi:vitamin B12 transporter